MTKATCLVAIAVCLLAGSAPLHARPNTTAEADASLARYKTCVRNGGNQKFCCEFNGGEYDEKTTQRPDGVVVTTHNCSIRGTQATSTTRRPPAATKQGVAPK